MKKSIYILALFLIFTTIPVMAYETSKQVKIDAVNSYQPSQFISGNAYSQKNKKEYENLKTEPKIYQEGYVEYMPLNESYVSDSPVSKEFPSDSLPVADILQDTSLDPIQKKKVPTLSGRQRWDRACKWIKGEPSPDAILLGMWSKHTGTKDRNEKNDLAGFQYGGVCVAYFKNSWYKNTYSLTVARRPWKKEFKHDFSIDFQYKAGIMNGYGSHAPLRLGPIEALVVPTIGLNYKTSGIDIWVIPSLAPVFAISYKLGLPQQIRYESVHAHYLEKHPPKPKPVIITPPPINQYEQIQQEKPDLQNSLITPAM